MASRYIDSETAFSNGPHETEFRFSFRLWTNENDNVAPTCAEAIAGIYISPTNDTSPLEIYFSPKCRPVHIEAIPPYRLDEISEERRKTTFKQYSDDELLTHLQKAAGSCYRLTIEYTQKSGVTSSYAIYFVLPYFAGEGMSWNPKALKIVDWASFGKKSTLPEHSKAKINPVGIVIGREVTPVDRLDGSNDGVQYGMSIWKGIMRGLYFTSS
ncbi:hypothetical protein BJ508DRAFT_331929 [Ascobolus immersus RN42]|uniref:Uncharacterized protein n=1 Tax=Ascobolus immersus RN42 TaxID=1160509 RepID=A0A3N4HUG0_ASCIM|nr:hypothetical protein BJ508DRAFT_331929 [Ascobolus immersus RN42]